MTSTLPTTDILRQTDLDELAKVLNQQQARATDVVVSPRSFEFQDDRLFLTNIEPIIETDGDGLPTGVTEINGLYVPTSIADEGFADKLDIPIGYLRKMRREEPGLYATNLNTWLQAENRNFLLRLLRSDSEHQGVVRAFLSDQYFPLDNIDVLMAVLQGITDAGIDPLRMVVDADLTDRRMVVRVAVPQIAVYADKLLENYRDPFSGKDVGRGWTPGRLRAAAEREGHNVQNKVIFAGFEFTNGETGGSAYSLTPRLVVGPCSNGMKIQTDAIRKTHLGAKLDAGIVQWSQDTQRANLNLITKQATDTVRTFLDVDYVTRQVEKLTAQAGESISKPQEVIAAVAKKCGFTQVQQDLILSHFITGGQLTTGGVMQAITSAAQVVRDGDVAYDMEAKAVGAMSLAHDANKQLARV